MSSTKKFDAIPKLDGSYKFLDDYSSENMLHGYLFYSQVHHGIIEDIKFPTQYDLSEFTIVNADDIPGRNIVPEPESDQPFLAVDKVEHFGQIILAIAHSDKKILSDFVKKIKVKFKKLHAEIDIKNTLDNIVNHHGKTIEIKHERNRVNLTNLHKTEATYYTPHQEQAYLEPQGMIARYEPKNKSMFIRGTMQCPFFVKEAVEMIMGKAVNTVEVETSEGIGGAFGGKEDFPNVIAGLTALLAYKSEKPVKIVMNRKDDIAITTKRHPARIKIQTFTNPKDSKIKKIDIDYRLDTGAFQTLSPVVLSRGVLHATSGYNIDDAFIKGRLMKSNTPSNGAFRGFGAPQAFFAIESHIDRIAHEMKISPLEFRRVNCFKTGDEFPSSQPIIEDHLSDCFERVIENSNYLKKVKDFRKYNSKHNDLKGIGISLGYHGAGYTGNGETILDSKIKIEITKNAEIKIFISNVDMGQGAHTVLAEMVSKTLEHPLKKTNVQIPNTSKTPDSGPTVASRTTYIVGNLLVQLAQSIKQELNFENLENYVENHLSDFPKTFKKTFQQDESVYFNDKTYQGIAYKDYSWAACVVEITFYDNTYQIEVDKIWNVIDIGKPVNIELAKGQVHGGNIQALGYAISEFFYKKNFGRMHGFTDYALPTSMDIPEIDIEFIHTDNPIAKGLGELPMDYPAPAIRNAFHNATGLFINEIPLTPERIFAEIQKNIKKY